MVVSIFVNPTQFNEKEDYQNYPRHLETDLAMLEKSGCDIAFVPEYAEVYPAPDDTIYDFGQLEKLWEGQHRPGHFRGVGMVVRRFFEIVRPHKAFFGLKDYQQLMIIKQLQKQFNLETEIVDVPTVREHDGLAMSSRNQLLSDEQRRAAPLIHATLVHAKQMQPDHAPQEIISDVTATINNHPGMQLEYFEIVDEQELMPVLTWEKPVNKVGCIAVHLGEIRLIDNIYFD